MSDKITRAELLANKLINRTITPEEEIELNYWYSQNLDNEIEVPSSFVYSEEEHKSRILSSIRKHTHPKKQVKLWPRIAVSAAIAVIIFGAGLYYFNNKQAAVHTEQLANDVAPGKNGATLTLANGKKILINDALTGKIANEAGVKISKTEDGQIIYEITGDDNGTLAYNTLATTRGEQTQVRLPDGSLVFLNAASSLKYPTSFAGQNKRMVTLTGEGYFEVAKDKSHPFVVESGNQQVEVLGTHFNINSYKDEKLVRTTLIEGSVKVTGANNFSKILKPNQQAVNTSSGIEVIDVEAQFFVDWKEGFFMFNNESLESITNRVARWYDVKVVYEDPTLKSKTFIGTISKYENISKVIEVLEGTGLAKFKINKGVLTISKKNGD